MLKLDVNCVEAGAEGEYVDIPADPEAEEVWWKSPFYWALSCGLVDNSEVKPEVKAGRKNSACTNSASGRMGMER